MASPSTSSRSRARLGWVAAAVLALLALTWGLLAWWFPPSRVRELVQRQLAAALARPVRFADASVGLWPPVRLTVREPEIAEPGGFERGPAFSARSIHLDLDVLALLGRRVVIRGLVVDHPALHLTLGADGTTNLDGIAKAPAAGRPAAPPMDLELRELRVQGGRVLVDDVRAARRTTFAIDSRVALGIGHGGARITTSGVTRITGLAFGPLAALRRSDLNGSLAGLTWRIEHRGAFDAKTQRLALERLALRLGDAEVALAGVVDEPGLRARVNLRARGTGVDLGQVLGALARAEAGAFHGIRGGGRLDFDLAARGALGPGRLPPVTGTLNVADGAFAYPGAPAGVRQLSLAARFAPDSCTITNFTAMAYAASEPGSGAAPLRGSLTITRFADPQLIFDVGGAADLALISPLIAPRGTRLGGRATAAVRGRGPARDPGAMALQGQATLADVSVESPGLPRKVEKVRGTIQFNPDRAVVKGLSLQAGPSSLSLDGVVTRPLALMTQPGKTAPAGVDFTMRSPLLDLADLLPVTPGAPFLPNARGGGTVAIARFRDAKLDVEKVSARIELAPGSLAVSSYGLEGYGGTVTGSARFDLSDAANPSFMVKAQMDSVDADALLAAWTPARGWLHGSLHTTLDLSGAGGTPRDVERTLTAVGLALVSEGTLGPGPALEAVARATAIPSFRELRFRDLKLPFRVERGRIITDPVTIEGACGRWQLAGGLGFDGTVDYAVSVTLPPEVTTALDPRAALAAGALADPKGNLLLDLRVTGRAAAPSVRWDTQALRDRVAGRVSQALVEQRARLEEQARASLAGRQGVAADSALSAVARTRQAVADTLQRKAGDLLKSFFGSRPDTSRR